MKKTVFLLFIVYMFYLPHGFAENNLKMSEWYALRSTELKNLINYVNSEQAANTGAEYFAGLACGWDPAKENVPSFMKHVNQSVRAATWKFPSLNNIANRHFDKCDYYTDDRCALTRCMNESMPRLLTELQGVQLEADKKSRVEKLAEAAQKSPENPSAGAVPQKPLARQRGSAK